MSQIAIGKAGAHNISIDLQTLLSTRLLLTADSGGGKTWALKRLIEQAFGHVGILVIDPEGEFAPMRQKLDFYLVGKGGDTPADTRSAGRVARALYGARASAICDIYEMKPSERHAFVREFLDALLEAPKELRRPYLVIVDEAHIFCPEHGKGESEAADSMRGLCTRGRKRLLCPIFATQRLATLAKDASSMLLNRMVGPTFEDVNRKRAIEELSVAREDQAKFRQQIQVLEPGYFYTLGRAITKELTLVHIGPMETPHGEEARQYEIEPPPPTEKVRALLEKLGDLPKQAQEEARTVADFKKQIRELKAQLKAQPRVEVSKPVADPKAIERAVREARAESQKQIAIVHADAKALRAHGGRLARALSELAAAALKQFGGPAPDLPKVSGGEIQRKELSLSKLTQASSEQSAKTQRQNNPRPISSPDNGDLSRPQMNILRALAEFEAIGRSTVPRTWVATRAGASHRSSAFANNVSALRSAGLLDYDGSGGVVLTDSGRAKAPEIVAPNSSEEMLDSCLQMISRPQAAILRAVYDVHPEAMDRESLAEKAGASPKSSAFANNVSALRSAGMVDYVPGGRVKVADWLFYLDLPANMFDEPLTS